PSRSEAAQGAISCPGTATPGQQFQVEVTIDVGTTPLGAYGITVTYDPALVTIASVTGGNTAEFQTQPTTNSTTFTSGSTPVSAFQQFNPTGPTGVVSVAKITFNTAPTASGTANIGLAFRSLFDTSANPITVTSASGCSVIVGGGGTTTS